MESQAFGPVPHSSERALVMERVIMAVRQLWFGAQVRPLGCATAVVEAGAEMLMCVDGDSARIDALVADAARRSCYVVATTASRPPDLGARLTRAGFRPVIAHNTYVWNPALYTDTPRPDRPRRGLLRLLARPRLGAVQVRPIGRGELPVWNEVCWRAFGSRGSESFSLAEKEQAFDAMGDAARWYLAVAPDGRAVGTAILYQNEEAAQVLAVGTLPGYRERGVATALMRCLLADWQRTGRGFLFLDTTPGSPAERLYMQLGFEPDYLREVYAPAHSGLTEL
ncbi:MAG TPA: GNAT family N-acetyltransferase [Symbiobacteriaceae bacterium]|nr:GNAT family N-acetyltransferase [Symbiobacteriaceae bacterium]